MKEPQSRAQWGSKLGFILAAAGSAVGLGNIWKFPGKAYEGGGGLFILTYLVIIVLIGIPVMMCEFSVGRASQANAIDAFGKLGHKKSAWVGWIGVVVAFIIASYYAHVGGWVMRYVVTYATGTDEIYADPKSYFYNLLGYNTTDDSTFFPWIALVFAALFIAVNAFIIIKGVEGGIEKFNKVGMPALFVLLLILLVRSVTIDGAQEGVKYMLTPDFSKFNFVMVLTALGQAFYSLSLGMAIMITYSSYLSRKESITKNVCLICTMDTLVALIAGFIIVPASFATLGADNIGKGGPFAFISLAGVFRQMPGGRLFGLLFYLLLLFAALTSCISILESVVAFLVERFNWKRTPVTIILCTVMFLIGCVYTVSQASMNIKGIWFDFVNGFSYPCFGDFMEYLTDRLMIPICSLGVCIFVGWVWKPKNALAEIAADDGKGFPFPRLFSVLVRYVAPISILLIIIFSFVSGTSLS